MNNRCLLLFQFIEFFYAFGALVAVEDVFRPLVVDLDKALELSVLARKAVDDLLELSFRIFVAGLGSDFVKDLISVVSVVMMVVMVVMMVMFVFMLVIVVIVMVMMLMVAALVLVIVVIVVVIMVMVVVMSASALLSVLMFMLVLMRFEFLISFFSQLVELGMQSSV